MLAAHQQRNSVACSAALRKWQISGASKQRHQRSISSMAYGGIKHGINKRKKAWRRRKYHRRHRMYDARINGGAAHGGIQDIMGAQFSNSVGVANSIAAA